MRETKKELVEKEETKIYCDMCNKCITHFSVCSICERDICYPCFGKPKEIKGLIFLIPCPICQKIKKYIPQIKQAWKQSDRYQALAFKLQRNWGKDSRKIK